MILGRSSHTPYILNTEPEGTERQGGWPRGVGDEPEAGRKQLQVRAVPGTCAVCTRTPG